MNDLFQRAESILEAASAPGASSAGNAIVLDRAGCVSVLDSTGWTLSGLIREYGAEEVFIISKSASTTTVEGWSATSHCTVHQKTRRKRVADSAIGPRNYAAMSQIPPQSESVLNERSPRVWNS